MTVGVALLPQTSVRPRLDEATLLTAPLGWVGKLHVEAREAVATRPARTRDLAEKPPKEPDPERSASESARRAAARIRVLAKANKITRLGTMTFAQGIAWEDRESVIRALMLFRKRLARRFPRLRWLWVLEMHPGGHGWHVHIGFDRFVPKAVLAEAWGVGFVDIRMLRSGTGRKLEPSKVAAYLAKYVAKEANEDHMAGKRRFSASANCVDTVVEVEFSTLTEFIAFVRSKWIPGWCWSSNDSDDWRGPPCYVMRA